jgi:radical SAM protein with 4Fe4S-binding SPASM domain
MDLTCPELDLGEWSERLLAPLQSRRHPLDGTFELTERCNLGCVHCYINQSAGSQPARTRELTTVQVKEVLDQVAEAGCLFLTLTGGEVLLRPDFAEIYRHACQRGLLVSLFTNATLLTPPLADLLAEFRPHSVEITLYGITLETYEGVTGVPGSYACCRRGIELLLERGLPLYLKSVLLTANRHELEGMRTLAKQLGVKFRYDGMLWPRLDGNQAPFEYQLSTETMVELDRQDPERQEQWDKLAEFCQGRPVRNEYVYSCGAGQQSFHIDSAGRMSICTMSRQPSYDLLGMSFQQAWKQLGRLREVKRQLETPCRTCTVGALCIQCPGWSQAVHGDFETPVEFVCALGHLRAGQTQHPSLRTEEIKAYEQETV